jgi:hypothetical protein
MPRHQAGRVLGRTCLRRFRDAVVDFPEAQLDARVDWRPPSDRRQGHHERGASSAAQVGIAGGAAEDAHLAPGTTREPKTTRFGSAIRYALRIWSRLTAFVDAPEVWLDNNATERGLRGRVIGRRNHFGSKSARGTQMAGHPVHPSSRPPRCLASTRSPTWSRPPPAPSARRAPCSCLRTSRPPPRSRRRPHQPGPPRRQDGVRRG